MLRPAGLVVLEALAASACGAKNPAAPVTPTALPAPTRTSTPATIPKRTYAIALYKFKLKPARFTMLTEFDQEWESGQYTIVGKRITFTDETSAPECGPEFSPFSDEWSLNGKALAFSNPEDKRSSRPTVMVGKPWVLQDAAQ